MQESAVTRKNESVICELKEKDTVPLPSLAPSHVYQPPDIPYPHDCPTHPSSFNITFKQHVYEVINKDE